ncbi:unnamed protein product [Schistosoma mattheei]|uniref:Mitochondrial import inner membrane translocase subunit TIM50 n=1 Tax=Schistosoma mattheei TaxID=31246 RepID=A0A183PWH9_9TREM|nr:unnamed protein product [Schistosoma mattheei]
MDPQGQFIHFRLFREATRYKGGKHIKDLSCLNRDLSRVVFVDWDPAAAQLQPRNSLIIKRWDGDESDRELIDLAAFLRMCASDYISYVFSEDSKNGALALPIHAFTSALDPPCFSMVLPSSSLPVVTFSNARQLALSYVPLFLIIHNFPVIAMGSVDDVRLVLDYYREFDDPLAFFREKHEELMVSQC